MYPVSENWEKHEKLGKSLIDGLKSNNVKIYKDGSVWHTGTTDSSGKITKSYSSEGVGDVVFTADNCQRRNYTSRFTYKW